MLSRAIVRLPAPNFSKGLTTVDLGVPEYELALRQHEAYCTALGRCGLKLTRLRPDPDHPDSCFIEDIAVMIDALPRGRTTAPNAPDRAAILARPGAPSRRGEVESVREALTAFLESLSEVRSPGTVDGGDVCEAGDHFFIGVSERTNEVGAAQVAEWLKNSGYTSSLVDVRDARGLLHLKSGLAYLGNNHLVVTDSLANRNEFAGYDLVRVNSDEDHAANCVRINDHVLIAAGNPKFERELNKLGYQTIVLEMSEFQKMDGGLSCLSLRF